MSIIHFLPADYITDTSTYTDEDHKMCHVCGSNQFMNDPAVSSLPEAGF